MSEQDNLNVVLDAYLACLNHNFDALRKCLAEDVKWFAIGPPDLIPTAGTRYGHDQVEQYFEALDRIEDIQRFEPEEFITEGNKVVAMGTLKRRVDAKGNMLQSPWIHVFTLRNGRISDFRSFYDTAAAVTALAVLPLRPAQLRITDSPMPP
ncbi:MAG TPA: nuclear transport factor 2 family protein [Pyrinomonadaceae bacterium]|jgi:ketosteroid isomerase-like protein|nr:nuclear transport factor 2 family protein [Pyrinomonadaceae bacterium]